MAATKQKTNGRLAEKAGFILDIGCGKEKQKGAVGMDIRAWDETDVVHDWNDFPWPFESSSVLTLLASNVVEHVNPADGHFVDWMNECWRVLIADRQMAIVTPYAGSLLFWADPTHINGCTHQTFWYFDPEVAPGTGEHNAGPEDEVGILYRIYEPAPWKIEHINYKPHGMMELVLRKREDRAEWHADREVHYR